jgi:hypothetical protein
MDIKFSNENKHKILNSLKYHIGRKLKGYNINSDTELQEIIHYESREIHNAFPELQLKNFNKKVMSQAYRRVKSLVNGGERNNISPPLDYSNPQTLTREEILNQKYEQYANVRDREMQMEIPTKPDFGMKPDDPIVDIDSELQRLTTSRDEMDKKFAPQPSSNTQNNNTEEIEIGKQDIKAVHFSIDGRKTDGTSIKSILVNKQDEQSKHTFTPFQQEETNNGLEDSFMNQFQSVLLPTNNTANISQATQVEFAGKLPETSNENQIIPQDQTFTRRKNESLSQKERIAPERSREQDIIIPRSIQQGYYDKENDVIIYSIDRNWTNDNETRYNFVVRFQGRNTVQNVRQRGGVSTPDTFKNVVGLQLVRAVIPNESLHTMVELDTDRTVLQTNRMLNSLQYPYLNLNIGSFNGEIQGTNDAIQHSFTNLIYDDIFRSDTTNNNSGYILYVPSDKTQKRVFYPTPLGSLKEMNIRLTTPLGDVLNDTKDCLKVKRMFFGNQDISAAYTTPANVDISNSIPYITTGNPETDVSGQNYIIIQTETYFRGETVQVGDIVQFTDVSVSEDVDNKAEITTTLDDSTSVNFQNFINRTKGHHIVAIAHFDDSDSMNVVLTSGSNSVGYANFIIIEKKRADYTTGYTGGYLFGSSEAQDYALHQHMYLYDQQDGVCGIDVNKQIQLVFKVYTRHYDGSQLQPQNN